jgi:CRISPR-associated endoribonuclease Cas6
MPMKLLLKFKLSEPVEVFHLKPKVIHGIFFSLFKNHEEAGKLLHSPKLKPFTLFFPDYFRKSQEKISSFGVELNILNNELFPELARVLFFEKEVEASVNGVGVRLLYLKALKAETFEGMLRSAVPSEDIVMDFLTPTSFKRGCADYVLPEPYFVFKNLLNRWNAFSPIRFPYGDLISFVKKNVFVSGCWLKTKKVEISENAKLTGFTGRVYFFVFNGDREFLKALNALASFAEFSGVGRKTTMGFGKVKFFRKPENEK